MIAALPAYGPGLSTIISTISTISTMIAAPPARGSGQPEGHGEVHLALGSGSRGRGQVREDGETWTKNIYNIYHIYNTLI